MKKIILPILSVFALLATFSCEDRLDIPQKGVVSYLNYYASDSDAEAALTNMYVQYHNNVAATEGIDVPEQVLLNYSADDILAAGGHDKDHEPFRFFCEFRYDDQNGTLKKAYQRYYYAIYHANVVIANFSTENRDGTEPKFTSAYTKQCVEEARVMRAYLHLMTALSWNQPPLMDRLYEGDELPTNEKTQKEILEWVIAQCDQAINSGSLPKRNGTGDKNATARMSVGFAQFIAGKAAMFNNDPATARKYLGDLIHSGDYALIDGSEYWTLFHRAGDGNSETLFEPNFIEDPNFTTGFGAMFRGRWMVANVFCWRTDNLAASPRVHSGISGWNGGAIQEDFAEKFLAHDGDSPRRRACFLTGDEWLYEMEWVGSEFNDGTLEQKKSDPGRGITGEIYSHGPYFEWKHMVFVNPPKILTGGKSYPSDHTLTDYTMNQTNYGVARYAEALLLYAEACIGSGDEAAGLKALQDVQKRSGSGKISSKLTFEDVMEEKQYELWFESCRFHDLVRWSKQGKVDLNKIFNESAIHTGIPTVRDEFFVEGTENYKKEHKLFVRRSDAIASPFKVGQHEYFPLPFDVKAANPNVHDVLGWAE